MNTKLLLCTRAYITQVSSAYKAVIHPEWASLKLHYQLVAELEK